MSRTVRALSLCALIPIVLVAGCTGDTRPAWVDDGATYTADEAREVLQNVDTSTVQDTPVSESTKLRTESLAGLRNEGPEANAAANLITRTFPADTRGVPVYVERALVDDRSALLIVEAWGPADGTLNLARIWVIDATTGDVLDTSALR